MPGNNAWNGKWSGEGNLYVKVINLGKSKKAIAKGREILDKGYFSYSFGDGWRAGISVKEVGAKESGKLRRKSKGFCGYDWMVDSIRYNLEIKPHEKNLRTNTR